MEIMRHPTNEDLGNRMRNREHVPQRQRVGLPPALLHHGDRDLVNGKSEIDEHAEYLRLKTETSGIGVPTHHIVAKVNRETVVVVNPVAGDEVDQGGVELGDESTP